MFKLIAIAALAIATTSAAPQKRGTCTFTSAAAAIAGKRSCSTIILSNVVVPAGTTLDMTGLTTGTTVTFAGKTTFGYKQWAGPMISVSGTSITVNQQAGAVIDFGGAQWWDGQGSNGGKNKPKAFYAHSLTNSVITGLHVLNTPEQFMSIDGANGLQVIGVTQDNSAGYANGLAENTDAFDISSSTGVHISGANIQNQDDCLAINSGTDISFTAGTCSGSHGLSIGSVGERSDNVVQNVFIGSSTVKNGQNGIRIKTIAGATGSVNNVTFSGITMSGITEYGIAIQQDYTNGHPNGNPTTGVPITDVTLNGVTGSVNSGATETYILCGSGSCSGWTWKGVSITGGSHSSGCKNIPAGASC